jgi:hypothetical protein
MIQSLLSGSITFIPPFFYCVKNYFPVDVTVLFTYSTFDIDARDFMKIYILCMCITEISPSQCNGNFWCIILVTDQLNAQILVC